MAVSDLVAAADVKSQLDISGSSEDTRIGEIIERVSHRFVGDIGLANLITATYTAEKYDGNGKHVLAVKNWPISAVSAASIEDESSIDTTSDDVFRYYADGRMVLVDRIWSKPQGHKIENVSFTYTAGYANIAAFEIGMPDAHEMLVGACVQRYRDLERVNKGIAAQAHMDGSVSYFNPATLGEAPGRWKREYWSPIVNKYRRWRVG